MITDLKHYAKKFEGVLPKNICEKSVNEMNDISFQQHKFYNPKNNTLGARSGSKELSISWGNISTKPFINNKIKETVIDYLTYIDVPWFTQFQGASDVRFNKYSEDTQMAMHTDHIHSLFDGQRKGIPILSVLGVLNENYEGGEFIMFKDHEVKFNTGDILVFPSLFLYPHGVKPVTKGTRYSYISWIW
jgi:hypothetical protein